MGTQASFETVTDWINMAGMAAVLIVLYIGWLSSYRTPKAAPVGSSLWFALPPWVQITAGLAISVIGVYLGYLLWKPLPLAAVPEGSAVLRIGGLVLLASGAVIFLWARHTLGAMYGPSTSSTVQLHARHQLIRQGPYALVRHPIYVSYWLILAGLLVIYRTWTPLVFLLAIVASLHRRARREEQVLEATFCEEWRAYAASVPMYAPRLRIGIFR